MLNITCLERALDRNILKSISQALSVSFTLLISSGEVLTPRSDFMHSRIVLKNSSNSSSFDSGETCLNLSMSSTYGFSERTLLLAMPFPYSAVLPHLLFLCGLAGCLAVHTQRVLCCPSLCSVRFVK